MYSFDFLEKEKWHFFHIRRRTPFFVHFWTHGLSHPRLDLGINYACRHVGHVEHKVLLDQNSFQRQRLEILSLLEEDPRYLLSLLRRYLVFFENDTRPAWARVFSCEPSSLSGEELAGELGGYFEAMARHDAFLLFPLFVESDLSSSIASRLSDLFGPRAPEYFDAAMVQVKDSLLFEEKKSLLKLASSIREKQDVVGNLDRHVERFSWMKNQLYTMDFYSRKEYLAQADVLSRQHPEAALKALEEQQAHLRQSALDVVERVRDDAELSSLIETAQEAVFFRNFRGEKLYQSSFYARPLLCEIACRLGLTEKTVVFLTAFEMMDLLRSGKKADVAQIHDRMASFALLTGVNGGRVVQGDDLTRLHRCIVLDETVSDQIRGQKGFAGKVRGRVFKVMTLDDLRLVPVGCVLVSPSTTPAYVPTLSKVVGIVTDEGGILCHAALISREMKLPSVIGTKNASLLLKDGDLVEVDGDAGTVRKLS